MSCRNPDVAVLLERDSLFRPCHSNLRELIQVFLRQTQNIVLKTLGHFKITSIVFEKLPSIERSHQAAAIAVLQFLISLLEHLFDWAILHLPILWSCVSDAHNGIQHLALVEAKGGRVDKSVTKAAQAWARIMLVVGKHL